MRHTIPAAMIACMGLSSFAPAQTTPIVQTGPPAAAASKEQSEEQERAKLLGVLVYTNVTVKFEDTPVREAIDSLKKNLGIQIIGRYSDDAIGFGIDPETPVSIETTDTALEVLEQILIQCEVYEDCTWQLRHGYVEVSTKERLSVPSAREVRLYHIRDFMIEPPRFATDSDETTPKLGKYGAATLGTPATATICGRNPVTGSPTVTRRKMPEDLATEIVEGIVEIVEPGKWDWGQEMPQEPAHPIANPTNSSAGAPARTPRSAQSMDVWASIRLWRDQLIVKAPDFMHRQINGYPKPIRPQTQIEPAAQSSTQPPPSQTPAATPPTPSSQPPHKP